MRFHDFAQTLVIAVLMVSTTAEATEIESHVVVSAPLILGVDASLEPTTTSTGAYLGVRPELIFAWASADLAFGFGPYASFGASTGTSQVWLGGGGTIVGYFGSLGVALSGGGECDWLRSAPSAVPTFGAFVGWRTVDRGSGALPFDLPFGVRVDVRPAIGAIPWSVAVSAEVDVVIGGAVLLRALSGLAHVGGSGW